MAEKLYKSCIHEDGSLDIPKGLDPEKRLELLELGMGHALSMKQSKKRYSLAGIQRKIEDTKDVIALQKAKEEEKYRQARNVSSNIIYFLLRAGSPPKKVPSER